MLSVMSVHWLCLVCVRTHQDVFITINIYVYDGEIATRHKYFCIMISCDYLSSHSPDETLLAQGQSNVIRDTIGTVGTLLYQGRHEKRETVWRFRQIQKQQRLLSIVQAFVISLLSLKSGYIDDSQWPTNQRPQILRDAIHRLATELPNHYGCCRRICAKRGKLGGGGSW